MMTLLVFLALLCLCGGRRRPQYLFPPGEITIRGYIIERSGPGEPVQEVHVTHVGDNVVQLPIRKRA
jgi:hypothetical protein